MKDQTSDNYDLYKTQRNKCTSIRRKSIKNLLVKKIKTDNEGHFWL